MTKIHAISLNTAIDVRIKIPQFTLGGIIRSDGYNEYLAGKAINNARAIVSLGGMANLYCFAGKNEAGLFLTVSPQLITHVVACEGSTRKNITLVDKNSELVCHIQNQGYSVTESDLVSFERCLFTNMVEGDIVVISGSVPIGTPSDFLNRMVREISGRKGVVLLDVDPPLLAKIDCAGVRLVKPNLEELGRLAGRNVVGIEDVVITAAKLIASQIVVVSLGKEGAVWIDNKKRQYWQMKTDLHEVGALDVIGCGDAMVGAIALGMAQGKPELEILKMGVCAGYAKMFTEGPGPVSQEHFRRVLDHVTFDKPHHF